MPTYEDQFSNEMYQTVFLKLNPKTSIDNLNRIYIDHKMLIKVMNGRESLLDKYGMSKFDRRWIKVYLVETGPNEVE